MPPDPLNGARLTVELNLGLEKSGNFIMSGKWQPWKCCNFALLTKQAGSTTVKFFIFESLPLIYLSISASAYWGTVIPSFKKPLIRSF